MNVFYDLEAESKWEGKQCGFWVLTVVRVEASRGLGVYALVCMQQMQWLDRPVSLFWIRCSGDWVPERKGGRLVSSDPVFVEQVGI